MKKGNLSFLLITVLSLSFGQDRGQGIPGYGVKTYTVLKSMPQFPGGDAVMKKWIDGHKVYPNVDRVNGIMGTVEVRFIIDALGKVRDVKAIPPYDTYLGKEAERVVEGMPKWKPGRKNGKPVVAYYSVSVEFNNNMEDNGIYLPLRHNESTILHMDSLTNATNGNRQK